MAMPVKQTIKSVWQWVQACLFRLILSQLWHRKPLFFQRAALCASRSPGIIYSHFTQHRRHLLSLPQPWYHSLPQPIKSPSALSHVMSCTASTNRTECYFLTYRLPGVHAIWHMRVSVTMVFPKHWELTRWTARLLTYRLIVWMDGNNCISPNWLPLPAFPVAV